MEPKHLEMSNISLIIEEREADIGNFLVGRLLPFRKKRHIGPFVFIDRMGPAKLDSEKSLDVAPHPHIGLSTLTYLFEGSVMHADSIGTHIEITPGAVNWMTAGKGVVHSERTPQHLRNTEMTLHGLQIWVALPKELEEIEPEFQHVEAKDLPTWEENGAQFKLICGEAAGRKSPVNVYSPQYMIEITTKEPTTIDIGQHLYGESGLYILEGQIENSGHLYGEKQILITKDAQLCTFQMHENSKIYIFGGEPLPEKRFIHWNFVSSSRERIDQAVEDWKTKQFPQVPGETEFVPYPEK